MAKVLGESARYTSQEAVNDQVRVILHCLIMVGIICLVEGVRPLIKQMMDIHDKVRVLAPGPDPFFQAVLVFTAAWVDAKWGSTGAAHCIREDQLYDYIVEKKVDRPLRKDEVKQIAQAFLGLAHVDEDLCANCPKIDHLYIRLPDGRRSLT
jgi:hypothetical protein